MITLKTVVRELEENELGVIEEYALGNPRLHVLVLKDIRRERGATDFYGVWIDYALKGFMVVYKGFKNFYSVIIEGENKNAIKALAARYMEVYGSRPAVIHVGIEYASIVEEIVEPTSTYKYYVMLLEKNWCRRIFTLPYGEIIRLDDKALGNLEYSPEVEARLRRLEEPYGVVMDSKIIGVGGYCAREPEAYMICGVYVEPQHRGKGIGKAISSHLVENALKNTNTVTLWVREDNYPAIKIYVDIGFKITRQNKWINKNTNIKP